MPKRWRVAVALGALGLAALAFEQSEALAAPQPEPRLVQFAQPGTPEAVIQAALVAALLPDEGKGFEAYLALVHPSRKRRGAKRRKARRSTASKAVDQIRRYTWKRFKKQAPDYVLPESSGGFKLARMDPPKIVESTRFVRVFVAPTNNPRRTAPVPVRLERSGDTWLITANSL